MSGINVASASIAPVAPASGATAGAAGGATSLAVHALSTTGAGLTLLLVVIALTFVLVGAVLLWHPLDRQRGRLAMESTVGGPGTHTRNAHDRVSG